MSRQMYLFNLQNSSKLLETWGKGPDPTEELTALPRLLAEYGFSDPLVPEFGWDLEIVHASLVLFQAPLVFVHAPLVLVHAPLVSM